MPATDRDAQALAYLARRLREETFGCREWDDAGTYAVIKAELVGKQLAHAAETVLAHATDPEARTPGAIRRPFTPKPDGQPTRNHPPRRDEVCPAHPAYRADNCGGCAVDARAADDSDDGPATPPRAWQPGDAHAGAQACRAAMRGLATAGHAAQACEDAVSRPAGVGTEPNATSVISSAQRGDSE